MFAKILDGDITPLQIVVVLVALFLFGSSIAVMFYHHQPTRCWEEPPVGSLAVTQEGQNKANITFGTFAPNFSPTDIKVFISSNDSDYIELWFTEKPDKRTVDMVASHGITATYTDYNYLGNTVNSGDFIIVEGLETDIPYTVEIYHYDTNSLCILLGDNSFILES